MLCINAGADLSDYFNYGFNEDTWKAYCDKQRRLRMSLEILSLSSSSKIMVHLADLKYALTSLMMFYTRMLIISCDRAFTAVSDMLALFQSLVKYLVK